MTLNDPFASPPRRPDFDPYSRTGVPAQSRAGKVVQYLLGLVAVAILLRVGISVWQFTQEHVVGDAVKTREAAPGGPANPSATPRQDLPPRTGDARSLPPFDPFAADSRPADVASDVRATLDLAKARQRELLHLRRDIKSRLDTWRSEARLWQDQVVPLLDNDAGKAVATNAVWVQGFRAVYDQPRAKITRAAAIEQLVEDLTARAESAAADGDDPYLPDKAALDHLNELRAEVDSAVDGYRQGRLQIAALVDEARAKAPRGKQTLRDALAEAEQAQRLEEVRALAERLDAANKEAQTKIAAAQQEAIRQAGDAEAKKILAAVAEAKAKQQIEDARQKEEQAKRERKAAMERDLTEIQRALVPFISKGYVQPNGRTTEALPMSYSKLAAVGALKPDQEGIRMLLATAANSNDRPRGIFPTVAGGAVEWSLIDMDAIGRAQRLLIQHGQAMVESGLLSP